MNNYRKLLVTMVKPISFSAAVRAALAGFGIDWSVQENIANQVAFKLGAFSSGTIFTMADGGIGLRLEIVDSKCVSFRFAPNPHEFDAEGCQER